MEDLDTRPLTATDKHQMQLLCRECFPIDYPDTWFDKQLSSDDSRLALGLTDRSGQLVAIIIGQLQPLDDVESEYGAILNEATPDDNTMYIVIFGVTETWRRHGIGSYLMSLLEGHVSHLLDCKAIYLHVEAANTAAINFYNRHGFSLFCRVPKYYTIRHKPADALLYVKYMNGGVPYDGSLSSWCQRYVWDSMFGRCLSGTVRKPLDSINSFLNRR